MAKQVRVKIVANELFVVDFLRSLADRIENGQNPDDHIDEFENSVGMAELDWPD